MMISLACKSMLLAVAMIVASGTYSVGAAERAKAGASQTRRDPVWVTLRPHVEVPAKEIRLADIATVTGGDAMTRVKLMDLDLEDALSPGQSVTIRVRQIELRLQLAGIDAREVVIRGDGTRVRLSTNETIPDRRIELTNAVRTQVPVGPTSEIYPKVAASASEPVTLESAILNAAKDCVMKRLPWPEDSVEVRFSQLLPNSTREMSGEGYQCNVEMKTQGPAVGRVVLRVLAISPGKPPIDTPVIIDVRHFDDVVLLSKSHERGHVITEADLYVDRRDVTEMTDYCSTASEFVGKSLRRTLRPLTPIRKIDVEAVIAKPDSAIVVKRKQHVRMVAHLGAIVIEATGEAQQDGRVGDVIRLVNVESNTALQGIVTASGEVEIKY